MVKDAKASFDEQCKALKGTTCRDVLRNAHPKPDKLEQSKVPGAKLVPFSDEIYAKQADRPLLAVDPRGMTKEEADRYMRNTYYQRWFGFIQLHALVLLCPYFFTWRYFALGVLLFYLCDFGITFSYHRQLSHRSFKTPKWLEYAAAFLGLHAGQGGPIQWVTNHRYHHLHTDTPLDLHTPYEGFWWAHMGWLYDHKACVERPYFDHSIVPDLTSQPYYRFLEATCYWQMVARQLALWVFFGPAGMVWGMAFPIVCLWHITWLVNSAYHLWGYRTYITGDLSANNWMMVLFNLGENFHNNHHAFQWSARHGLEWWEVDLTYCVIRVLEVVGLAWDVQVPTQEQKAAKRKAT